MAMPYFIDSKMRAGEKFIVVTNSIFLPVIFLAELT